ncbi:DUF1543 domain-containing protein [Pedobacter nototheniae]|uniref:DUF1543 domain-containing protein n=1 Tax=Pedobacter nototheniae TaxID=2488994 RepID=UPI0010400C9B|nr:MULTISPECIES: DUF1543 domain-containing protein [Pedobacter]
MEQAQPELKLYQLLLGSKAPKRNVEQHDYFFGIARSLKELVPQIKAFWPEAGSSLHVDGWREVNVVNGYKISIIPRLSTFEENEQHLFFINLGGYQQNKLEEQHYTILTVQENRAIAVQHAKKAVFFKTNSLKGANAHIDEKYGIDVDEIYKMEDILDDDLKKLYRIQITPTTESFEDEIHLGYFKLDKL